MELHRRELLLSMAGLPLVARAAPRRVRIPKVSAKAALERSYAAVLLEQALAAAGMQVTVEPTAELIPQNRALHELGRQARLDVVWTMTSIEREQQALPVRIPIYKGLYGWRLLLALPEVAARLREVQTLDELRRFSMVQGLEWPDIGILQSNGLNVIASPSYEAMFKQLRLGRADAFPRSVEEVWWELARYGQGLTVVPDICLHYPAAVYYFVAPDEAALAAAIELGLRRMLASGAFDRLFMKYHSQDLARTRLGSRRVITLHNPLLPPLTPLHKPEFWHRF
ncbi:ABC transporter substrate-binding protein [Roseateles sp.]|uniref:substrate-binding periplasmic protein n=1 Tax=Roseateles sp. TaxID=1971397 RepID=UPI0025DEB518|nr:transporter substrate-binding domain-containing protein [Roseateles sp.]MBV8034698.1 transporter substrate-binding domain-containing protein [Roseateles sp.]